MSIAVLGAGINGLATATAIQNADPRIKVTLIAEKFSPNTTSDIAAGYWRPIYLTDKRKNLIKKWSSTTYKHIESLAQTDGLKYGASVVSGYELSSTPIGDYDMLEGIVRNLQTLSYREVRAATDDHTYTHGVFFTSLTLSSEKYLPILLNEFQQNGGVVEQRRISSIDEVANSGKYSCIVNSTGLGSRELMSDQSAFAIRGQVYRVKCNAMKHFYIYKDPVRDVDRYILPNNDWIVIGGTHTAHDYNTEWSTQDGEDIWNDVTRLQPTLKNSEILGRRVGLRPARTELRVEPTQYTTKEGNSVTVVHNYGHGGSGLTLFRGCALDCAEWAIQAAHKQENAKL